MPEIPPDILHAIVGELDADTREDRGTLRSLLSTSKQINAYALRPFYRGIYFFEVHYNRRFLQKLSTLARDAEHNPGLRFTTAFLCTVLGGAASVVVPWGEIYRHLKTILHSLPNLGRTTISFQSVSTDVRILQSLPPSAPLTHLNLAECSMSREHLLQVLQCRPGLQWLDMYIPGQTQMAHDPEFPADVLPHLTYLSAAYSDVGLFKNPLISLISFTLHTWNTVLEDAGTIRGLMAPFVSITACHLPAVNAANVVPIVSCFPCLEYLWVQPIIGSESVDYTALSATRLKYLRCMVYQEIPSFYGRRILDAIDTLVVVDVSLFPFDTLRLCRSDEWPVHYPPEQWTRWWEHAQRAVESAISNTAVLE
ncbi:hypothetical protein EYR40_009180 [Pleurotus pulmonarius]|nr:hypothetical protein EYR40_009180 [Pleurotus pulmonarius]